MLAVGKTESGFGNCSGNEFVSVEWVKSKGFPGKMIYKWRKAFYKTSVHQSLLSLLFLMTISMSFQLTSKKFKYSWK